MIEFSQTVEDIALSFRTTGQVFSPSKIDSGTLFMIQSANVCPEDYILDLGCGYGAVGIYFAKKISPANVVMSDIDPAATQLARENTSLNLLYGIEIITSDGFKQLGMTGFTHIFVNPPYHTDFSVPKHFIEKGFNRLVLGGRMHMVTMRREWYEKKLTSIFGGVRVICQDGYFLFQAQKRQHRYAKKSAEITSAGWRKSISHCQKRSD